MGLRRRERHRGRIERLRGSRTVWVVGIIRPVGGGGCPRGPTWLDPLELILACVFAILYIVEKFVSRKVIKNVRVLRYSLRGAVARLYGRGYRERKSGLGSHRAVPRSKLERISAVYL